MSIHRMAAIDVPTYTEDASDSYTKLLLHCDGTNGSTTFTDKIGKTFTASGNAQISTAQSVFRGASGSFDGNGDYISTPSDSYWDFTKSAFTIDFRVRFNTLPSASNYMCFMSRYVSGSNNWNLSVYNNAGTYELRWWSYDGVGWNNPVCATTLSIDTWYHITYVYNGTNMEIYKNGTQVGSTASINVTRQVNPAGALRIGANGDNTQYLNGYIDELRISTSARWTANFTPPTAPYDTTITQTPTNANVTIIAQYRGLSGVNRQIKAQYRGYGGVNRLVFGTNPTYLYNLGDECTTLTGGWSGVSMLLTGASGINASAPSATKNSDNIYGFLSASFYEQGFIKTANAVNLTFYNTIYIDYTGSLPSYSGNQIIDLHIGDVSGSFTSLASVGMVYTSVVNTRTIVSIDISSITGNHAIGLRLQSSSSTGSKVNFYKVWLE